MQLLIVLLNVPVKQKTGRYYTKNLKTDSDLITVLSKQNRSLTPLRQFEVSATLLVPVM